MQDNQILENLPLEKTQDISIQQDSLIQQDGQDQEEFESIFIQCPICQDIMKESFYFYHIELCEQQIGKFSLREQQCQQCGEQIVLEYLNDHLEVCVGNFEIKVQCPFCMFPIIKAYLQDHIKQCTIYLNEKEKEQKGIQNCQICLEDIEEDQTKLNCSHAFHKKCIENWIQLKNKCPVCKRKQI